MKNIRFRGKMLKKNKDIYTENNWVKGYYVNSDYTEIIFNKNDEIETKFIKSDYIFINADDEAIEVDSNTVGQYIGLKDMNGKEIFEGDILKIKTAGLKGKMVGVVVFDENDLAFELDLVNEDLNEVLCYGEENIEILGNIYDNPELLKEK